MSGFGARLAQVSVLAGLAAVVTAAGAAAGSPVRTPILGVVPHTVQPAFAPHLLSKAAIQAAGPTTLTFDASYQSVINQYFTDVAHDSLGTQNVYSVATQYYDNPGPVHIQYQSTFGGSYVDKNPLPASACNDHVNPYCLTDAQLKSEIQAALTAKGWHGGLDHIFFLMTPNGVGTCFNGTNTACATNTFCAFHSFFPDSSSEDVIYADEPYEGPYPGCTGSSQGFPNGVDADTTVNTISHEHNESITDPLGTGWLANDLNADENGDLCAFGFGAALDGTPGVSAYNQVINGHHYDLQQEYSNADAGAGGCVQRPGGVASAETFGSGPLVYNNGPVMHTNTTYAIYWLPTARNTGPPVVTGTAVVNQTLSTSAGTWAAGGAPFTYQWQSCSSTGTRCVDIPGGTATTYKLTTADDGHVVRSTVRATNVNGLSLPAASTGTSSVLDLPGVTRAPHIAGRAKVGKKLAGSHGAWTYRPKYRFQWLRCDAHGRRCSSIRHATHSTYRLTKLDAGHRLRLRVTAVNAAGRLAAISAPSPRVGR